MKIGNISIKKPVIVVVEGLDDQWVLEYFCEKWGFDQIQFIPVKGKLQKSNVDSIILQPNFKNIVKSFGLIRDADDDYENAKKSIQGIFSSLKLEQNTGFFIFPNNEKKGLLETLFIQACAIQDNERYECINNFIECLSKKTLNFLTIEKIRLSFTHI